MDQITHEVRSEQWREIIRQCQERPDRNQTVKAWLKDNGIADKSYYYWLRKLRKEAYQKKKLNTDPVEGTLPAPVEQTLSVAEIPAERIYPESGSAVTIKTGKMTVEIATAVSESAILELVKAVAHAV